MAYTLCYFSEFKDDKNIQCRIEIYRDSSQQITPVEVRCSVMPVKITFPPLKHKLTVVRSSGCEINMISSTNMQLINLYTAKPKEFKVCLFSGGQMIWSGYLNTENYLEPFDEVENYDVQITANDGFKVLERIPYYTATSLQPIPKDKDIVSQWEVIKKCLSSIGLDFYELWVACSTTISNVALAANETIFHKTMVNPNNYIDEDGKSKNSLEVLEWNLAPYGLFIQKYNGIIKILDNNALLLGIPAKRYSSSFDYLGQYASGYILGDVTSIGFRDSGADLEVVNSYNKATVVYSPYVQKDVEDYTIDEDRLVNPASTSSNTSSPDYSYTEYRYNQSEKLENIATTAFNAQIIKRVGTGYKNQNDVESWVDIFLPRSDAGDYNQAFWHFSSSATTDLTIQYHPEYLSKSYHERILKFRKINANLSGSNAYYLKLEAKAKITMKLFDNESRAIPDYMTSSRIALPLTLKIGDLYYSDTAGWTNAESFTDLVFCNPSNDTGNNLESWMSAVNLNRSRDIDPFISQVTVGKLIPLSGVKSGQLEIWLNRGVEALEKNKNTNGYWAGAHLSYTNDLPTQCRFKDFKISVCDKTGKEISTEDVEVSGILLQDFEEVFDDIHTYHGTNKGVNADGSDNLSIDNPLSLGGLMMYDTSNNLVNIKQWTRQGATSTVESLLLRTVISNYQFKTLQLKLPLNYVNDQVGVLTYSSQFPARKFVIAGSEVDLADRSNILTLVEISNDLSI